MEEQRAVKISVRIGEFYADFRTEYDTGIVSIQSDFLWL
jgi:hypothetical protein